MKCALSVRPVGSPPWSPSPGLQGAPPGLGRGPLQPVPVHSLQVSRQVDAILDMTPFFHPQASSLPPLHLA